MEKIKNMINPGKSKDDEVMYGSGQSSDPVHNGTGSQAIGSKGPNDSIPSSADPAMGSAREPVGQGGMGSIQQGSVPSSTSQMPGAFDNDGASATSIKSGLPGNSEQSKVTGLPESRDPLDTNKALPREPTTGGIRGDHSSTTAGTGPHSSSLVNKVDPRVESDTSRGLGTQSPMGTTSATTNSSLPDRTAGNGTTDSGRSFPLGGATPATSTTGPHASELANKADPRVGGGVGSTSGYGAGTSATTGSAHQGDLSRSAMGSTSGTTTGESLPKGYGAESWSHDHLKHGHNYEGDPCENEPPAPGAPHFTSGPHSLDTTNRLDPHISAGTTEPTPTIGTSTSQTGGHHSGATAAMGAGLGATGAGAYQAGRDMPTTTSSQRGTTTTGPHDSDMMNRMDPRVDSKPSTQHGTSATSGTTSTTEPTTGRDHHHGKDAALTGAGVGTGTAAVQEGEKYRSHDVPQGTSSSGYSNPYPPASTGTTSTAAPISSTEASGVPSGTSKDHHYGRDAGFVGAGAGAAYEADKHLGGSHGGMAGGHSTDPYTTQQPLSRSTVPSHTTGTGMTSSGLTSQPQSTSGVSGQPTTVHDEYKRPEESHKGRDAAIGAGAGVAAAAGANELSKKDMEREAKAAHEQDLKDQKAHQHELEKERKAHDKALAKDEKKHQHDLEKADKAHEKALAKEEAKHHKEEPHEGEKKHHGLFGFLHRDKSDKELKEDEIARKERMEDPQHGTSAATGAATGVAGATAGMSEMDKHQLAKEHDRNRLHKDPPPGFGETEYAEAPEEGYASQVTGGTGTTALAQGDPVARGSHATGMGNKMDPSITGRGDTVDSDRTRDANDKIVEPQTGLPMNLQKGDGAGGTDSTPVPGYHPGASGTHGTATGSTGTTTGSNTGGEGGFGHLMDHSR
ncbi:MAG: hypothetical protein Q9222_002115 [Ikaeria aurantiellina]